MTHITGRFAVEQSRHDADVLDNEVSAQGHAFELRRGAQLAESIPFAADQDEAAEVATVRLEDPDLKALDLTSLLELAVVGQRFSEDLGCLDLPPANGATEPYEDSEVGYGEAPLGTREVPTFLHAAAPHCARVWARCM